MLRLISNVLFRNKKKNISSRILSWRPTYTWATMYFEIETVDTLHTMKYSTIIVMKVVGQCISLRFCRSHTNHKKFKFVILKPKVV